MEISALGGQVRRGSGASFWRNQSLSCDAGLKRFEERQGTELSAMAVFEGMIAGSAARLHISVNEPTQSEFATSHIDAGQAWEVAWRDRSWPTGAFCQFVPPAGTRAGLSQRDNLHLWQRSRTPFYFIFIFFVRFSAPRDIHRRNA
jgi:hypothetical protein